MDDPFDLPPDVLRRIPLFAELSKVLSWSGGPVNWDLARQIATSVAAGEAPVAGPTAEDDAAVADHVRVAELWLTDVTGAPAPTHLAPARAANQVGWAEHACTSLAELIDPVAAKIASAIGQQVGSMDALGGGDGSQMLSAALGQMSPMFMGIQAGTIIGSLAREITGAHDLAVPTGEGEIVMVLPEIDAAATTYALERTQVRQYVALQAAAHRQAFEGFMRSHFFALYHGYVAALNFDLGDSLRRLQELDLSDPSRLHDALGDEALFTHEPSPESRTAAAEIGRFLALTEAYISEAVAATTPRMGEASTVREALARRANDRATGRSMLERFIGLGGSDDGGAARFVREVLAGGGWELLHRITDDPMALPSTEEIDDPGAWRKRVG